MADAFDRDTLQIQCTGHHPHLRKVESGGCQEEARTILLGASNSWFPLVMSALSLPPRDQDKLALIIEENWTALKDIPSLEVTQYVTAPSRMPALVGFTAEQIWTAIQTRQQAPTQAEETDNNWFFREVCAFCRKWR